MAELIVMVPDTPNAEEALMTLSGELRSKPATMVMLPPFPLIVRTYRLVNPVLLKLGALFALGEVVGTGAAPVVM